MGALPDQVAFELGQRPEDVEDELAAAGGGVDLLLQGLEADAPLLKQGDGVDEVAQGAAKSIQPPDDQGVAGAGKSRASSRPGRSAWEPLAVSVNSRSQPALVNASCWRARVWSAVETRA